MHQSERPFRMSWGAVMLKRLVRPIIRKVGFDVVRYHPILPAPGSTRTTSLTFYETATGKYFLPTDAQGDIVANAIKSGGIFEEEVVNLAGRYIKPGTVVIDAGANFGQMSILFSRMAGDSGRVYSLEADDFVFEILTKNIEANERIGPIVPVFGAVHDTVGETLHFPVQDFKRFPTYGSYGIDYSGGPGRPVKTFTIDSLNIEAPVSFMKIDIQGGDLQAMQGAVKTIKRNRMPIIFEYEYSFEDGLKMSFQDYVDFVQGIDYRFQKLVSGHNFLIVPKESPTRPTA
jgi:FkbM family methyltransferase